jgi:hypothetical protein
MWSKPGSTEVFVAPEEEIEADNGKQYLWRPISITDAGVGQFADPADPDPAHSMKWDGYLYRPEDRSAIMNVEGHPYVHQDWTTSRTGKGRTQTARARMFMEALMGRDLEDSEINDELTAKLLECIAVVIFSSSEKTSRSGESYFKLKIDKAFPYRPKTAAAPVAARPAARTSARPSADLPFPEPSNWP